MTLFYFSIRFHPSPFICLIILQLSFLRCGQLLWFHHFKLLSSAIVCYICSPLFYWLFL